MYDVNLPSAKVCILYHAKPGTEDNPALDIIEYSVYVKYHDSISRADFLEKGSCSETQFFGNLVPIYQERNEVILIELLEV